VATRAELARLFDFREGDVAGADGIIATPIDPVGDAMFDAAGPQLKVVANFAVGTDNIDFEAARARGIVIANTPDVLTAATAELAIGLLLSLQRRIAEGDRFLRRREEWGWSTTFMLGTGLQGLTLGVLGHGRIGREVGRLAEAHGMQVLPMRDLERIGEVDVLTLHCPLTPETRHLIDAAALARMKPTAVLVNTARGPVVDEAALVEALQRGTIAGAALDVYEREPEVTEALLGLENVVLTPHLGSATVAAREGMGRLCIEALRAVLLEGRDPANRVA
jgi:glyoxylate reductase